MIVPSRDGALPGYTPARKVVGLIRVSTADQAKDDRGGIPRQRHIIEETISRKCLDCIRVYEISDDSGTQVIHNPQIREILELIRSGVAEGLVVADLDRLFRPDQPTDYAILQVFKDTGAVIYSGETEYNLGQKDSALFANIRSAISGWELQTIRERSQGAKEAKRRQGKCPTNEITLPLGVAYDRKQQKFIYNEKIAKVIEIFRLYDEEGIHNYSEIGRRTGVFNVTVRNILRNPLYTGWRIIDQKRGDRTISRTGKSYRKKTKRSESEIIKVQVFDTPAISQECFDRVQREMERVRYNHHDSRNREMVFNLGAGVARCGHCGEILLCSSGKRRTAERRHPYYGCKSNHYQYRERLGGCKQVNIRGGELDALLEAFTCRQLSDPEFLTSIIIGSLERSSQIITPFPDANHATQIASLKKREKRLLDAYEDGAIELDELRRRREDLRKDLTSINHKKEKTGTESDLKFMDFIRLVVRGALRLGRIKDLGEKKAIILDLFSEIYVKDHSITAFKFKNDIPLANSSEIALRSPIQLATPFTLMPSEPQVPDGHRKCSRCSSILPASSFYPKRGQCLPCLKDLAAAAYQRRKKSTVVEP